MVCWAWTYDGEGKKKEFINITKKKILPEKGDLRL